MRVMSIDLGLVRTGIAISDETMQFAFPDCVINEYNEDRLIEKIISKSKELNAQKIICGLPKNMDGTQGERAEKCKKIGSIIQEKSGIEIIFWDERLSTVAAYNLFNQSGTYGKKRKQNIDSVAACVILEGYLNSLKNI